jgi:hypothetical protein
MIIGLVLATFLAQGGASTAAGGGISGRVLTPDRKPAVQVRVGAAVVSEGARKAEELAGITVTDAEGRYLLENLPAGRYRIVAGPLDEPTFFPGVVKAADATRVAVAQGGRITGIDFQLTANPTLRISGVVHRKAISPSARFVLVRLVGPNGTQEVTASYSGMKPDPLFEFRDIVPGSYRLDIRAGGVATPVTIDVVGRPVTDILLGGPIVTISGSTNFEPGPIGPHMQIVLTNAKPGGAEISGSIIRSTFTVEVPPGEYHVTTRRTPASYTVESIISGTKDLLKETLQVDANNPPTIEIKLRR